MAKKKQFVLRIDPDKYNVILADTKLYNKTAKPRVIQGC